MGGVGSNPCLAGLDDTALVTIELSSDKDFRTETKRQRHFPAQARKALPKKLTF
jgi:hypothetical protein